MNIEEIVRMYLKTNGYNGLCLPEQECGCRVDDLFPCENAPSDCQAGHLVINDNGDWIIIKLAIKMNVPKMVHVIEQTHYKSSVGFEIDVPWDTEKIDVPESGKIC